MRCPTSSKSGLSRTSDENGHVRLEVTSQELLQSVKVRTQSHGVQEFDSPNHMLRMAAVAPIDGRVAAGLPRVQLHFEHFTGETRAHFDVETDEEGRFSIPAFPLGPVRFESNLRGPLMLAGRFDSARTIELQPVAGIPIKGRLVIRGTNRAIPNASVAVRSGSGLDHHTDTTSNELGEFNAFALAGQPLKIQVYALNFRQDLIIPDAQTFDVPAGESKFTLPDIAVDPARIWDGKLIDEKGASVDGRYITLLDGDKFGPTRTDAKGQFRIALPEGFSPKAWRVIWAWNTQKTKSVDAEIVSDDPLVIRMVRPLDDADILPRFAKGQVPQNEAEQKPETVVGTLVGTDDLPAAGIDVLAFEGGNQLDPKFKTDKHGQFRVPKAWRSSDHFLTLVARDGNDRIGWFDFFFHGHSDDGQKSDDGSFKMVLLPLNRTIQGRVVDPAGQPLAKIGIQVEYLQHEINFASAHWRYQTLENQPLIPGAITDQDGNFELKLPANTSGWLGAVHPDWIARRIHVLKDKDDVAATTLAHAAKVAGRVVDSRTGRPLASASIAAQAIQPNMETGGWGEAKTDAQGNYVIGGLPAGQFSIILTKSSFKTLTAPAFTRELTSGKTHQVDFSLIVGKRLAGRVVDAETNKPIAKCPVNYSGPARPGPAVLSAETDRNGEFEFFVPPGKSHIYIADNRDQVDGESLDVDVPADNDPEPVVLKAGRKLEGAGIKIFPGLPLDRKVSFNFDQVPLVKALEKVCNSAAVNVEFAEEILNVKVPVTLKRDRIPLRDALTEILKPFKGLSFTFDQDRILFSDQKQNDKARRDNKPDGTSQLRQQDKAQVAIADLKIDPRLDQPFDSAMGKQVQEVLADIASQLGVRLRIDQAEIWANECDHQLLEKIEISTDEIYRIVKTEENHSNQRDWARLMLARGDGTITIRELLVCILEPLILDYCLEAEVLHVSTIDQITNRREAKSSSKKDAQPRDHNALRSRIVSHGFHNLWMDMAFKVEVKNFGDSVQSFDLTETSFDGLFKASDPTGKPVPVLAQPVAMTRKMQLKPGETATIFETENLSKQLELTRVGQHTFQFVGGLAKGSSASPVSASLPLTIYLDQTANGANGARRHLLERLQAIEPRDWAIAMMHNWIHISPRGAKVDQEHRPVDLNQPFIEMLFVDEQLTDEQIKKPPNRPELLERNSTGCRFVYLGANNQARTRWPQLLEAIRKDVRALVQPEHIALVGRIDLHNDAKRDREQFHQLLKQAGISIDIEFDDDGRLLVQSWWNVSRGDPDARPGRYGRHRRSANPGKEPGTSDKCDRKSAGTSHAGRHAQGFSRIRQRPDF